MNNIDENTRQRIQSTIAPLAGMFPNWKPDKVTIEGYVVVLADLDPLTLEAATLHLLSQPREFMPTAGTIRHTAFDLQRGNGGPPAPYEAWEQVGLALNDGAGHPIVGRGMDPPAHPLVKLAVRYIGGWTRLSASENTISDRARFIDAYKQIIQAEETEIALLPIVKQRLGLLQDGDQKLLR